MRMCYDNVIIRVIENASIKLRICRRMLDSFYEKMESKSLIEKFWILKIIRYRKRCYDQVLWNHKGMEFHIYWLKELRFDGSEWWINNDLKNDLSDSSNQYSGNNRRWIRCNDNTKVDSHNSDEFSDSNIITPTTTVNIITVNNSDDNNNSGL